MTYFPFRLFLLWLLLWVQRTLRLSLRIVWTATAGLVIAYGIHTIWGVFPDWRYGAALAAGLALLPLIGILTTWPHMGRFAWKLDRLMQFKEQVSAALEVTRQQRKDKLSESLTQDANQLLDQARNRILLRGWYLSRDLSSMVIVAFLIWLLFAQELSPASISIEPVSPVPLPMLGSDPSAHQIFPTGLPWLQPESVAGSGADDETAADHNGGESENDAAAAHMEEVLKQLGDDLSQQTASYNAGQALQKGDLAAAAREMEIMGERADIFSTETAAALSAALDEAAQDLQKNPPATSAENQQLAEDLSAASEALAQNDSAGFQEAMDQVARKLREGAPGSQLATAEDPLQPGGNATGRDGGAFAGASDTGAPQAFERLQGEGDAFTVEAGSEEAGLLSPGNPLTSGEGVAAGSLNQSFTADGEVIITGLTPYHLGWEWRDVVSTYFTPP